MTAIRETALAVPSVVAYSLVKLGARGAILFLALFVSWLVGSKKSNSTLSDKVTTFLSYTMIFFIGVFVAAVLTVVAGLLMPNVSAPVATDQPAPRDAEAATG